VDARDRRLRVRADDPDLDLTALAGCAGVREVDVVAAGGLGG
jgi:hypothetical protein